ncbi:hypothetical protein UP17_18565 [Peribacillus simplex]|uniref:hypothetical protein n=1 Tax=Peribacillus simplex TaxID=1478 RepID=UPI0007774825|nr:hypothetical protein [Peribacillus simplex]AMM94242.1 hypothetical protein UP17_18565 [Peribacillus simplex]
MNSVNNFNHVISWTAITFNLTSSSFDIVEIFNLPPKYGWLAMTMNHTVSKAADFHHTAGLIRK